MELRTFPRRDVREFLDRLVCLKVKDGRAAAKVRLRKRFDVSAFPTLVLMDPTGTVLLNSAGGPGPEQFVQALASPVQRAMIEAQNEQRWVDAAAHCHTLLNYFRRVDAVVEVAQRVFDSSSSEVAFLKAYAAASRNHRVKLADARKNLRPARRVSGQPKLQPRSRVEFRSSPGDRGVARQALGRFAERWPNDVKSLKNSLVEMSVVGQMVPWKLVDGNRFAGLLVRVQAAGAKLQSARESTVEELWKEIQAVLIQKPKAGAFETSAESVGPVFPGHAGIRDVTMLSHGVRFLEVARIDVTKLLTPKLLGDRLAPNLTDGRAIQRQQLLSTPEFAILFSENRNSVQILPAGQAGTTSRPPVLLAPLPFGGAATIIADSYVTKGVWQLGVKSDKSIHCSASGLPIVWGRSAAPAAMKGGPPRLPNDEGFRTLGFAVYGDWGGYLFPVLVVQLRNASSLSDSLVSVEIMRVRKARPSTTDDEMRVVLPTRARIYDFTVKPVEMYRGREPKKWPARWRSLLRADAKATYLRATRPRVAESADEKKGGQHADR